MSNAILTVSGVHKSFRLGASEVQVLRGASLSVQRGEFLAITGASGSGKSTLLHLMGALDVPDRGHVTFDGKELFAGSSAERDHLRNVHFGFVFQFYHLLPELSAMENVLLPAMVRYSIPAWLRRRPECRGRAKKLLEDMGLKGRLRHRPNELSGGELQRVAVVRSLINRPKLLLADEPTGSLDRPAADSLGGLLVELNGQFGVTLIVVTHAVELAGRMQRVLRLLDGVLVGPDEAV